MASLTRCHTLTIQSFKPWSARSPFIRECIEAAKAQEHTRLSCSVSPHMHIQSNYRETTRPGPCAPSDLVPGQIDEALHRPSRSNNSFLALITRTRVDLQVLCLATIACLLAALLPKRLLFSTHSRINEKRLLNLFFLFVYIYPKPCHLLKKVTVVE